MNLRSRNIIAFLVVVAIAFIAWLVLRSREPQYDGSKLTEWIVQYGNPEEDEKTDPEARTAIRAIGTRAIPRLLNYVSAKDSATKEALMQLARKQEVIEFKITSAAEFHKLAVAGFHALGKEGAPAIPSLVALMNDTNSGQTAIECLWGIGSESTEVLIAGTKHTNYEIRWRCVWVLSNVATNSPAALAAIIRLLDDNDSEVRYDATLALGRFQHRPAEVVPLLIRALNARDSKQENCAALALGCFGTNAVSALPDLERVMYSRNSLLKPSISSFVRAIEAIRPEYAFPLAAKLLSDSNPTFRWSGSGLAARVEHLNGRESATLFEFSRAERDTNILAGIRIAAHQVLARWRTNGVPERATFQNGFLVRGPQNKKCVAICLWGDSFAEGADVFLNELKSPQGKASFFLTDNFLTNRDFDPFTAKLFTEQHYLGCYLSTDVVVFGGPAATAAAAAFRARYGLGDETPQPKPTAKPVRDKIEGLHIEQGLEDFFLAPPGLYDRLQLSVGKLEQGVTPIAPTPGTLSGLDATHESQTNFVSSQAIFDSILQREREDPNGLNGFILMFHLGSGPGRTDKFHLRFGELLDALAARGYTFVRVDELFEPKEEQ
ncbi:MAG: HEAT repeat domain-containing protein [Verrucomicrobia bacterium]|nr:HEAT repeat domain-containing protein [Verrucomicrobiota bacterium]